MAENAPAKAELQQRLRGVVSSEAAIYGVLVISALIVVTGQKSDASWDVFLKVFASVIVLYLAHVFAAVVSHLGVAIHGDTSLFRLLIFGMKQSIGILLAALLPLGIILLGASEVLNDDVAVWAALWADILLLAIIGFAAIARTTKSWRHRWIGATVTALLGVAIMGLKVFIH